MSEKKFLTDYPELVAEWDYEKNIELNIAVLKHGSHKKVWWKCGKCSHSWQAIVKSRARLKRGCPKCAGIFSDPITITHPEIIEFWDYSKNNDLLPESLTAGMHRIVQWKCERGHCWEGKVFHMVRRKKNGYCLECRLIDNDRFLTKESFPELFKEWDFEKNIMKFTEATKGSNKKVWWHCDRGHSYSMEIPSRFRGRNCPQCAGRKQTTLVEDFPHLVDEWDDEEDIRQFTSGAVYIAQWKCSEGHVYKEPIHRKVKNGNCAVCVKRIFKPFYSNDKNLLNEWDYEKNDLIALFPEDVSAGSHKRAWWKCSICHYSWESPVYSYCKGSRCAKCWARSRSSKGEIELADFVESACDSAVLRNERSLIHPYELDVYIPDLSLAFEFNGDYWHSDEVIRERSGMSADEYHDRKVKLCANKGVDLFYVWESEWLDHRESIEAKLVKIIEASYTAKQKTHQEGSCANV